jgi:AraC-like DNA-binding protein
LSLALDCGFNSKSTFNRAFRKYAGKSPGQMVREIGPGS